MAVILAESQQCDRCYSRVVGRRRNARLVVLLAALAQPVACQLVAGLGGERVDDGSTRGDAADEGARPPGDAADAGPCAPPPDAIEQVAAGASTACVVTGGGRVYCWGEGSAGQLGVDPTTLPSCDARRCTAKPLLVPALDGVRSVAVGADTACAAGRTGALACWGADDEHQLGSNPAPETTCAAVDRPCRFAPEPLVDAQAGPGDAAALSVSGRTACAALGTSQVVSCWGSNTTHMLGPKAVSSTIDSDPSPYAVGWFDVYGNSYTTDTVSLNLCSPGDGRACHGCLVSSGALACWGADVNGELGHAPGSDTDCDAQCNATPTYVTDVYEVVSVASGDGASCAVRSTDGHVFCWGNAANGQMGVRDAGPSAYAWEAKDLDPLRAVAIDGRARTFCALTASGDVFCWGRATDGEVGALDAGACEAGRCARLPTPIAFPANVKVRQVSVGDGFALALGTDGTVYAWGSNAYGRLGHPPGTSGDAPCAAGWCNPVPTPVCW